MPGSDEQLPPFMYAPGRAAVSNAASRFEPYTRQVFDDGWEIQEDRQVARTSVQEETAKKILTRNNSPDIGFDQSINPYRGCEHGCIYCFARPTHAYLGYSPGLDFETKLIARPNAAQALAREIAARGYRVTPIALGTNTDPYQPIEARYRLMRQILEVLRAHNHPVTITTKGSLIERDLDILRDMASRNLVQVGISVTSLDAGLSRALEPRAPAPQRRLRTIAHLAQSGIPTRLMVAPVIPGMTDHEVENLISAGAQAGAQAANWIMLRLPSEVEPLMQEWLHRNRPEKAEKVMARMKDIHDGQSYRSEFGIRMRGTGAFAQLIAHRMALAIKKNGLSQDLPKLDCTSFHVPGRAQQLSLF